VTRERGSRRDRHVVKNSRMCNCVDDVARAAEQDLWAVSSLSRLLRKDNPKQLKHRCICSVHQYLSVSLY
jgi:hypothetical protein